MDQNKETGMGPNPGVASGRRLSGKSHWPFGTQSLAPPGPATQSQSDEGGPHHLKMDA